MTKQDNNPVDTQSFQHHDGPPGTANVVTVEYLMERLKQEAAARHAVEKELLSKQRKIEQLTRGGERRTVLHGGAGLAVSEAAAYTDQLTGLSNRFGYNELLSKLVEHSASKGGDRFAIFMIDLDLFKAVNDDFGHEAGDVVLTEVADRLRSELRDYDCIARVGGDEFVVICHIGEGNKAVEAISERVIKIIERKISYREFKLGVSCSVGVAVCPDDANSVTALERAADTALYAAKRNGRGRWQQFQDKLAIELSERRALAKDLQVAIRNRDVDVWLYPTIDLKTGVISSVEALARWCHPTQGYVQPAHFIELAEEHRLMEDLGQLIIDRACGYATHWLKRGFNIPVTVNMSRQQLAGFDAVEDVNRIFEQHSFDPRMFGMEVTEDFLVDCPETTSLNLFELSNMGVGFHLDDFGTGYSNLEHLSTLPLHTIKLDRTLVGCVNHSPYSQRVLKMVLGLTRSMSLKAVAEGVETLETLNIVSDLGFDHAQGYYYSKPLKHTDFMTYLMRLA